MRVLERGSQYNGSSRFDTWLFAIARHLVIDAARKKSAVSLDALTEPREGSAGREFASAGPTPFDTANMREASIRVSEAVRTLDVVQREVVMLRFQEELSLEEIATITQAPLSTVKSRLYRGLEALRPGLRNERARQKAAGAK